MAVLVNEETRVLVQGITGRQGSFHTKLMLDYGTKILAGVVPGKGGGKVHGVPVYDTVSEALEAHPEINTSIVFVPAKYAFNAVLESIENGIPLIVVITENIPELHSLKMIVYANYKGVKIIGPNTPGIISPGKSKVGIMPGRYFKGGRIGIAARSGTLMYEVAWNIAIAGFGVSTAIGVGGDPIVGLNLPEAAVILDKDEETDAIVIVGEIGTSDEEKIAELKREGRIKKPVVAYVAGRSAPKGKKMGHAGAIVYGEAGSYESKIRALKNAEIPVAETPWDIGKILKRTLHD